MLVSDVIPYPKNAKIHTDEQIKKIAESIIYRRDSAEIL